MKTLLPAAILFCGLFNAVNRAPAQTWTQATNAPIGNWHSVASSADGNNLIAAVEFGGVYISTNSGVTWTQ